MQMKCTKLSPMEHFAFKVFFGEATQMQGSVPFPKTLFPLQSGAGN